MLFRSWRQREAWTCLRLRLPTMVAKKVRLSQALLWWRPSTIARWRRRSVLWNCSTHGQDQGPGNVSTSLQFQIFLGTHLSFIYGNNWPSPKGGKTVVQQNTAHLYIIFFFMKSVPQFEKDSTSSLATNSTLQIINLGALVSITSLNSPADNWRKNKYENFTQKMFHLPGLMLKRQSHTADSHSSTAGLWQSRQW